MHWSNKYIGKQYIVGEYDCGHCAEEIQRNEFGRVDFILPQRMSAGIRGLSKQIEARKEDYVLRTETPEDGDLVLMKSRGALNHIGVFFKHKGVEYTIHAMKNLGAVASHRINDLKLIGLTIEGYYKFK